ncbi:hypothetical protein PHET_09683 [Paragonimus heterotremus]|uniref:Uncharacterized protein n=1 Tax=Paragonimus heterotremus TaxID=100268 RepID=A0A8J4SGQ7_9TREM|nr:hypothetical protein PHET_09683 [Paragonimus heterotremus]
MKELFHAYCEAANKGSKKATEKTIKKIFTDCKLYNDKLTVTVLEHALRKYNGNDVKEMDFEAFSKFIDTTLAEEYAKVGGINKPAAIKEIKDKIKNVSSSKCAGAPRCSSTSQPTAGGKAIVARPTRPIDKPKNTNAAKSTR